jgi:hypothetical protein
MYPSMSRLKETNKGQRHIRTSNGRRALQVSLLCDETLEGPIRGDREKQ